MHEAEKKLELRAVFEPMPARSAIIFCSVALRAPPCCSVYGVLLS
jgi:hypothetical protein